MEMYTIVGFITVFVLSYKAGSYGFRLLESGLGATRDFCLGVWSDGLFNTLLNYTAAIVVASIERDRKNRGKSPVLVTEQTADLAVPQPAKKTQTKPEATKPVVPILHGVFRGEKEMHEVLGAVFAAMVTRPYQPIAHKDGGPALRAVRADYFGGNSRAVDQRAWKTAIRERRMAKRGTNDWL